MVSQIVRQQRSTSSESARAYGGRGARSGLLVAVVLPRTGGQSNV